MARVLAVLLFGASWMLVQVHYRPVVAQVIDAHLAAAERAAEGR